jgi:hypothetical protein
MYLSTATTVIPLLPGLPQVAGTAGFTEISALVTSHIRRAEGIVMSKVSRRYDMSGYTITTAPPLTKTLTEDISSFFTYRSEFSSDNQNFNDWTDKFNDAMTILDEIMNGNFDLVDTAGALIPSRTASADNLIATSTENYTPTFGEDSVTAWAVDTDKLDSLNSSRS